MRLQLLLQVQIPPNIKRSKKKVLSLWNIRPNCTQKLRTFLSILKLNPRHLMTDIKILILFKLVIVFGFTWINKSWTKTSQVESHQTGTLHHPPSNQTCAFRLNLPTQLGNHLSKWTSSSCMIHLTWRKRFLSLRLRIQFLIFHNLWLMVFCLMFVPIPNATRKPLHILLTRKELYRHKANGSLCHPFPMKSQISCRNSEQGGNDEAVIVVSNLINVICSHIHR